MKGTNRMSMRRIPDIRLPKFLSRNDLKSYIVASIIHPSTKDRFIMESEPTYTVERGGTFCEE